MKKILSLFLLCLAITLVSCGDSNDDGAGTGPVKATFRSMAADGGATVTTTKLTLTFDKDIEGLAVADFSLAAGSTGAVKGVLAAKGSGVYELGVTGVTVGGEVTLTVSKAGYEITPASQIATVYYVNPVKQIVFSSLTANGSATETTTELTLTFDEGINGLAAGDIILTAANNGIVSGALAPNGLGGYILGVSGITAGGEVTVSVSKAGYEITPASQTVTVHYVDPAKQIVFSSLAANGSVAETTTILTLTFDKDVEGLVADDISLPVGKTGAVKGVLAIKGSGVYELGVTGITVGGEVTVTINKAGYEITPASRTVPVYYKNIVGEFYYSDKTHSAQRDPAKECIGIVFWQNPDDATKGKIVSLDEKSGDVDELAMWAASKKGSWKLMTKDELQHLWCAYNGAGFVATWVGKDAPCPAVNAVAQTAFNGKLTAGGGVEIPLLDYISSTDFGHDLYIVGFRDGFTAVTSANGTFHGRASSDF